MPETSSKPPRMATLESVARHTRRAEENAAASWGCPHDMNKAREFADKARVHCSDALSELSLLGVRIPAFESDELVPLAESVPIDLLDTHASRLLLDALEFAAKCAMEVDRERGWVDSDGESVGLAESVEQMALGLRYDIHGPAGRD